MTCYSNNRKLIQRFPESTSILSENSGFLLFFSLLNLGGTGAQALSESLWCNSITSCGQIFFFFLRFYLFIFREGKGRRKRGRETSTCGYLLSASNQGPGLQPRLVPWLGIEPVTLWFTGLHSIHWAIPARARGQILMGQARDDFCYFQSHSMAQNCVTLPYIGVEGVGNVV